MKKLFPPHAFQLLFALAIATYLFTLSSCKNDPEPIDPPAEPDTPVTIATRLLTSTGNWTLVSVTVDGENAAELFKDFSINFKATATEKTYTTNGSSPVWPASGTWDFTDSQATAIKRQDNLIITITTLKEKELKIELTWDQRTFDDGRVKSIPGKHVFTLGK